uniref:Uncharacterized protein n=1 Tax=Arcella intermedia TaxID=1963864 RepID=A0A6B2KWW4_9EUKA
MREALRQVRENPPGAMPDENEHFSPSPNINWPPSCYSLIGREDLAYQGDPRERATRRPAIYSIKDQEKKENESLKEYAKSAGKASNPLAIRSSAMKTDVEDGTELYDPVSYMRFSKDQRLQEVRRVLCSSRPAILNITDSGLTDHDLVQAQQKKLFLLCQRSLALSVGRAMFTMSTVRGLQPLMTETVTIPPLSLHGKIKATSATIGLDKSSIQKDMLVWPTFHNGVASGLRIARDQIDKISSTWIVYNRPPKTDNNSNASHPTEAHAGLLMALGLQGHLKVLALTKVYEYLSSGQPITSVALLIGMAACRIGTQDQAVAKLLSIHVPSMHPSASTDLEVPSIVQTSALVGLGLLYMGTSNRQITEVLLQEIGRRPTDDKDFERESYSLAAGLALGMVVLGSGNTSKGLSDLNVEDRLVCYTVGGHLPSLVFPSNTNTNYNALFTPSRSSTQLTPRNNLSQSQSNAHSSPSYQSTSSNIVLEGVSVNLDITAPGAVLALGLMYIRTEDMSIALRIAPPNTEALLETVRPDVLLLRVLAFGLIMWKTVIPSKDWIEGHLPESIRGEKGKKKGEMGIMTWLNVVAGSCFVMGLKFAGTGYSPTATFIRAYVEELIEIGKKEGANLSGSVGAALEMCTCICALALSLVMSGSGDLDTFRIYRKLRKRVSANVSYGSHMCISMAIGFLFLGGGRYTLGNHNEAIAALICALYPRFPQYTTDNRYHLQALRHLHILAAEQRCVECRDIVNERSVYVPLEVKMRSFGGSNEIITQHLTTPCLLPPLSHLQSVKIDSKRYWGRTLYPHKNEMHKLSLTQYRTIYVKRKEGFLSYGDDPTGHCSLANRPFPKLTPWMQALRRDKHLNSDTAIPIDNNIADYIKTFSEDRNVRAFAEHFCDPKNAISEIEDKNISLSQKEILEAEEHSDFTSSILYQCLIDDKPEMVAVYLKIYQTARTLQSQYSNANIVNIKIINTYYHHQHKKLNHHHKLSRGTSSISANNQLLESRFLSSISMTLHQMFYSLYLNPKEILQHWIPTPSNITPVHTNLPKTSQDTKIHHQSPKANIQNKAKSSPTQSAPLPAPSIQLCYPQARKTATLFGIYLTYYSFPSPTLMKKIFDWFHTNIHQILPQLNEFKREKEKVLCLSMHLSSCPWLKDEEVEGLLEVSSFLLTLLKPSH